LNNLTYLLQIWYRDGGRILPAYNSQMTHKWAWLGSPDQFRNIGTPYNWQNIKGKLHVY